MMTEWHREHTLLTEASTARQFRAVQAEERLKPLAAGDDVAAEGAAATREAEPADVARMHPAAVVAVRGAVRG